MTATPITPDDSPFMEPQEAANRAGMSISNIRRRCVTDGFAIKPGGRGPWRIRRELFMRWLNGEKLR